MKRYALLLLCWLPWLSQLLPDKRDDWSVNVMDVGQGLAVVVMRNKQALIYDVGGRYPSGFNMADAVLLPFLSYHSIESVDWLILSHFDNDHAGAQQALQAGIEVRQQASPRTICRQGWQLHWQGLQVKSLWPATDAQLSDNDGSCVVRIEDASTALLLPGDISEAVESILISENPQALDADILLVPHHGSRSSSSSAFVESVSADFVVFSEGYRNRWGFPAQQVVNRYVQQEAKLFSTAQSGQIQFTIPYVGEEQKASLKPVKIEVKTYREDLNPIWTGG